MVRMILGVLAGFIAWLIAWVGGEMIISAVWPAFAAHQRAFQNALTEGADFTPEATMLLTHIVLVSIVSLIAGCLASIIAGENKRAPLVLGFLLLTMGLLKAAMSWQLVPVWYHVVFTAMLLSMAIIGGRLTARS
jgi:hypothetical protein